MEEYKRELVKEYRKVLSEAGNLFESSDIKIFRSLFEPREDVDVDPSVAYPAVIKALNTALILLNEVNLGRVAIQSKLAYEAVKVGLVSLDKVEALFGAQVGSIVRGLVKANDIYAMNPSVESDNFRKLLLTMAQDIRVIIILICDRLYMMRILQNFPEGERMSIAKEVAYLYAPLAHRLGLYRIKSELEDLSLKYMNSDIYHDIAKKLNETKRSRDKYIADFIGPLKEKLEAAGFQFSIKGRTKSIYSIWNKMKKQNTPFENIYDLFAIRVILDTPIEKEKSECWQVYSIVTDMYQPNPKRLRDWLSIPKSNGYESLHITVMGPQGKWVEVQIRTERMDEIAEKGLAAHFKYKGVKGESDFDKWLANIREILENPEANAIDYMDDFKLNLYDKEVFVFTPSGDLQKLPKGATVLDFAFQIHSALGVKCVGGRINGKNVSLRQPLSNGDQVEVLTSPSQKPKQEWLNIVQTAKAKTRIKQILREQELSDAEMGKEVFLRRLKNWKLEYDEAIVSKLAKKLGVKTLMEFFQLLAGEKFDLLSIRDLYMEILEKETKSVFEERGLETYEHVSNLEEISSKEDVLVIDKNLKGIQYQLSKCCNPIYGDEIFGFITVSGGIKIHKKDCPNAPQMMRRFGYRFVKARWSGKSGSQYPATLHVIGNDDIGIVTNITSLISKDPHIALRSISVDPTDGLFQGTIIVLVDDSKNLEDLIKKVKCIKGVKSVERS
ncbi:MAG: bifunctional (p)ppGpp synthetase/guanosine-3',5'-bis(diphosphate) 3'-pyrophosphohydrolase [Paludibacteraceae bacterium]|nr:bifunctional (p)ppGpp synthetase/guanosine-3',5'-bis(diphosphate) 3'-pyrophosphohydrolase [Paludibacteraceae bacterium]